MIKSNTRIYVVLKSGVTKYVEFNTPNTAEKVYADLTGIVLRGTGLVFTDKHGATHFVRGDSIDWITLK